MPADRKPFTAAARPVKTERTHEENQERAYIAASRRSDRSLEARIESARRASEIHKKRTGRALRVTEQDVINEEMYEEEDDDLPTQYQRLNAHLHTTSVMFNKKLHDYIATQHGVRNMFMSQYQNQSFQPYGTQFSPTASAFPASNNWLSPSMFPPQQFTTPTSPQPQSAPHQAQHFSASNQNQQQQGGSFRQSPYQIPQRTNSHQRSLSIQLPHATPVFDPSTQSAPGDVTTPQDSFNRRLSLPPSAFNQQGQVDPDGHSRPSPSSSSTTKSAHHSVSPQTTSPAINGDSGCVTPQPNNDADVSFPYSLSGSAFASQVLSSNPLSMSLPPESQQLIGSALDPNDPRTALFMAGSDNLPQPFTPTYTYNPNFTGKLPKSTSTEAGTLAPASVIKAEPVDTPSSTMHGSISDSFFTHDSFLTPGNGDYNAFFDFQGTDYTHNSDEQGDGSHFVNWD